MIVSSEINNLKILGNLKQKAAPRVLHLHQFSIQQCLNDLGGKLELQTVQRNTTTAKPNRMQQVISSTVKVVINRVRHLCYLQLLRLTVVVELLFGVDKSQFLR